MRLDADGVGLHWREDGDPAGPPVLFLNSLGTDLRLWDKIVPALGRYRVLRMDMRGHGQSDVPPPPYAMGTLVRDAERLLDHLAPGPTVIVGLSIGGMIAQGLAVKRPDLVRAIVLSCTAARMGTAELWHQRIAAITEGGLAEIADGVMARWFGPDFLAGPELATWRSRFLETPAQGYIGCCHAIAGTDFYTPTSGLRLPALGIAGREDGAAPPDLMRETMALIPGSVTHVIPRAGHLPPVETPEAYHALLDEFLKEVTHG